MRRQSEGGSAVPGAVPWAPYMPRFASLSGLRAAGLRLAAAFGLSMLAAATTIAQPVSPSVIVDWSALDAAGPVAAPSTSAPITLKPPPRVAATAPASAPMRRAVGVDPIAVPARPSAPQPRPAPATPPPTATASAATTAAPVARARGADAELSHHQGRAERPHGRARARQPERGRRPGRPRRCDDRRSLTSRQLLQDRMK